MINIDRDAIALFGGTLGLLVMASAAGAVLHFRNRGRGANRTVDNFNARVRAWWIMVALLAGAVLLGTTATIVFFALISFLALREMITLSPTRRGDHHTLFWAFFVMLPGQYLLVHMRWIRLFQVFIPVYAFLFIAIRSTFSGDCTRYLERAAKIQWATMICIFCLSHAPALLILRITNYEQQSWKLFIYLILIVQLSDVLQYCWGKVLGRHKIAPLVSPNKTVEGFVGGVLSVTLLGMLLTPITPFVWWESALASLMIALLGFLGGIVMSAIKRDAGVKDFGQLIDGHGGMMDRVDSLSFAAPVFFHFVRYFHAMN